MCTAPYCAGCHAVIKIKEGKECKEKNKIWKKMNFCEKTSSILSSQKHSKLAFSAVNKGVVNQ